MHPRSSAGERAGNQRVRARNDKEKEKEEEEEEEEEEVRRGVGGRD